MILDNNSYVRRVALYSDLFDYNNSSQFGPKLPATVPSSKFPTILDNSTKHSYSVLTYENNQNSYPSIDSAYTFKEPKYFVGKCPNNEKIRDFGPSVVPVPTPEPKKKKEAEKSCNVVNEPIVEGFQEENTMEQLKKLNILLFIDKKCPFSRNQLKQESTQTMDVIDIKKKKNKQMFTDYGGFATPFFYSLSTNRSYTGFEPNDKTIVKNMSVIENFSNSTSGKIKDLDIVIYSSKQCPYCNMLYKMLSDNNQLNNVTIVDDMNQMENIENIQGFPYIFSRKTKKHMTGAPQDLDSLLLVMQEDEQPLKRTEL